LPTCETTGFINLARHSHEPAKTDSQKVAEPHNPNDTTS
jgi:hypothetical protein